MTQKGITGFGVSEGAAGTVNIRGVGSGNKVLMLFDGQPQWAGVFGHALPDTYVASDVERVEVIRGPGSYYMAQTLWEELLILSLVIINKKEGVRRPV